MPFWFCQNGIALPFRDRLGINVTFRSALIQQICETMPDAAAIESARTGKPVAIEAVGR
jgi:hypothetical protein